MNQTAPAAIASVLGREQRAVQHLLEALEETGFVARTDDVLRPDLARFEDRRTMEAWKDAQPRFRALGLGPHFEDIARDFTFKLTSTQTVGGQPATVGPAVVNDAAARTQHEVDVVAIRRNDNGSTAVLALGEAKRTTAKRTSSDLARLEHIRNLVSMKHPSAQSARLLLFSASGFEHNLTQQAAKHNDVELINLERLYTGE